jgi:predicted ABC-type ATPase
MAKERVTLRVSEGGHNIPEAVIERRFTAGLNNFASYFPLAYRWYAYANTQWTPTLIARGEADGIKIIHNFVIWERLKKK